MKYFYVIILLFISNFLHGQYDLKINKIIEPQGVGCYRDSSAKITVSVTGVGNDSFSMSDILYLGAEMTSPTSVITTYGPIILSGFMIQKDSTKTFTIATGLNLTQMGNYSIRAIAYWTKDVDHTNDTTNSILVVNKPTAKLGAIAKNFICTNDSMKLSASTSIGATTYQWYRNSTTLSPGTAADYWVKNFGVYYCIVTNVSGCDDTTSDVLITSKPIPLASISSARNGFCPTDSVLLYSSRNAMYSYQWYKNNNIISAAKDSGYFVKSIGNYALKITDTSTGCVAWSNVKMIDSFVKPSTALNPITASFCTGDSLRLFMIANPNYSYIWKKNGSLISAKDYFYFSKNEGSFVVEISDSVTGCKSISNTSIISENPIPTSISSVIGASVVCATDSVHLKATTCVGCIYQWMKNGVVVSGAQDSFYFVKTSGSYSVQTSFSSTACFTISSPSIITVKNPINAKINYFKKNIICYNTSAILNADSIGNTSSTYQWTKNNVNIPSATTANYTVSTSGVYKIKVTNNGCELFSNPTPIVVEGKIDTSLIVNGLLIGCPNNTTITAVSDTNMIYKWYDGIAPLSATGTIFSIPISGNYFVKITSKFSECVALSKVVGANYNMTMKAPILSTIKPVFCQGDSVLISIANMDTAIKNYHWYLENVLVKSSTSSMFFASETGVYTLKLDNNYGCNIFSQNALSITSNPLPIATISSPKNGGCIGDSLKLSLTNITGIVSMQWYKDGQMISGATLDNIKAKVNGNYTIRVTDVNQCTAFSPNKIIKFVDKPNPTVAFDNVNKEMYISSYPTIQWYSANGLVFGAINTKHKPSFSSDYYAIVTDSVGCEGRSSLYAFASLNIQSKNNLLYLYPNPVSDFLYFKNDLNIDIDKVKFYSISGNEMCFEKSNLQEMKFDVSTHPKGEYICAFYSENKLVFTQKFTKK
jgi:large repetitive protein